MFELKGQQTKITSFVPRMEKHGEENVLAGTLKMETTMHSAVLNEFDGSLRKLLYRKPAQGEQSELPLEASDGLTARKLPHLKPLVWDEEFPGYKIEIVTGLAVDETLKISAVEIHGFVFEALDGGSCTVRFTANFNQDGRTSGKLCQLIQETVELSLIAPSREEQKDLAA